MFPPKLIKPYVISFCRGVVGDPAPRYVPVRARANAEIRSCFTTVSEHVRENGGESVVGWAIWEWPDVIIEAEYHCVWRSPSGEEVDVTPKNPPVKQVLFLPDPKRPYEGYQRDNVRKVLCKDKDVARMAELGRLMHEEMNRGELKHQHGAVLVSVRHAHYEAENDAIVARLRRRYGDRLQDVARRFL